MAGGLQSDDNAYFSDAPSCPRGHAPAASAAPTSIGRNASRTFAGARSPPGFSPVENEYTITIRLSSIMASLPVIEQLHPLLLLTLEVGFPSVSSIIFLEGLFGRPLLGLVK
jgi:hypothetical protein